MKLPRVLARFSPGAQVEAPKQKAYNAFLSYSHAADNLLAPALQEALYRFARPFYRMRALRIFRDESSLQVTPELWPVIQQAIRDSEFFVLLASPGAACSTWVQDEVNEWLAVQNGSVQRLLIVLTEGRIEWDSEQRDFDWSRTDALPGNLAGRFEHVPFYLDLRWARKSTDLSLRHPQFLDATARLAAALHIRPLDELIGEHVEQQRLFRRVTVGVVGLLLFLIIVSSIAAIQAGLAARQARTAQTAAEEAQGRERAQRELAEAAAVLERSARNEAEQKQREAERQREIALARTLVAQAEQIRNEPLLLERSVLLAAEAMRRSLDLGLTSLEVDEALRRGLALLPRPGGSIENAVPAARPESELRFGEKAGIDLAWSQDGKRLTASASSFGVRVWSRERRRRIATIGKPTGDRTALSPDGSAFVRARSQGGKTLVEVVDTANGNTIHHLELAGNIYNFSVSPKGTYLAAGNPPEWVLWELGTEGKKEIAKFPNPVAFSPDGEHMVAGQALWRLPGPVHEKDLRNEIFQGFSPDGELMVLLGGREYSVRGVKLEYLTELLEVFRGTGFVALSAQGRYLATISAEGQTVSMWEVASGREVARVEEPEGFQAVAFSPEGQELAVVTGFGEIDFWKVGADDGLPRLRRESDIVGSVIDAEERNHLVVEKFLVYDVPLTDSALTLTVWKQDLAGRHEAVHAAYGEDVFAISADGRIAAIGSGGSGGSGLTLFDLSRGRELLSIDVDFDFFDPIVALAFSPDSRFVAAAWRGGQVRLWQVPSGRSAGRFSFRGLPKHLAISPDGHLATVIATARPAPPWDDEFGAPPEEENPNLVVRVWNAAQGRELESFALGREEDLGPYALSPDGRSLATTADKIVVRELPGRKTIAQLSYDSAAALVFDRSCRQLGIAEERGLVRVVHLPSGQELVRIRHIGEILSFSFSPSGKFLSTVNGKAEIQVSLLKPQDLLAAACARLNDNLTPEEWERYVGPGVPPRETCPAPP